MLLNVSKFTVLLLRWALLISLKHDLSVGCRSNRINQVCLQILLIKWRSNIRVSFRQRLRVLHHLNNILILLALLPSGQFSHIFTLLKGSERRHLLSPGLTFLLFIFFPSLLQVFHEFLSFYILTFLTSIFIKN